MANKYYIWKDPNCNGTNPEWIEISGEQFFALGENKTRKRYFKRIDDGFEDGADVLIFETTYEEYKEWHKKQESKRRKKKSQEKYMPKFMSLEDSVSDTEFTYSEIIPDISINIEDDVLSHVEYTMLQKIIASLSDEEKQIFKIIKQAMEKKISERQICREMGIEREQFRYKREKVFEKIKKSFPQK